TRLVHRLDPVALDGAMLGYERASRVDEAFALDYRKPGAFENLLLRTVPRVAPGPGQLEIRVAAAGLNFRDIMKVLGIYPRDGDTREVLGDECAGTVVAVGAGVSDIAVGDRVVAIASGFKAYVTVDRAFVAPLPGHIPFAAGATIPIAFLTAH